jgi:hypothetical protein
VGYPGIAHQEVNCYWVFRPGNNVPIRLDTTWAPRSGNDAAIVFTCSSIFIPPTNFDGFINVYDGIALDVILLTSIRVFMPVGEYTTAGLYTYVFTNFDPFADGAYTTVQVLELNLLFKAYDGVDSTAVLHETFFCRAYDGAATGSACAGVSFDQFSHVSSAGNATTVSPPTGFVLKTSGDATYGDNLSTGVTTTYDKPVSITWTQVANGTLVSDNSTTFSPYAFAHFFTNNPASITTTTSTDPGRNPFGAALVTSNPPYIALALPKTPGSAITLRVSDGTTSSDTSITATGVDLFDGLPINVTLKKALDGKAAVEVWHNDALLYDAETSLNYPSDVLPIWHFDNGANSSANNITVDNLASCDGHEFIHFAQADVLVPNAHQVGEFCQANLYTRVSFVCSQFVGEDISINLTLPNRTLPTAFVKDGIAITVDMIVGNNLGIVPNKDGAYATADITVSHPLGTINAYDGVDSTVVDLYVLPAIRADVYDGVAISIDLRLDPVFGETFAFDGVAFSPALTVNHPQNFGILNVYDGPYLTLVLHHPEAVFFYPRPFYAGEEFYSDEIGFRSMDLDYDIVVDPWFNGHANIELAGGPPAHARYWGCGLECEIRVDLKTLPVLHPVGAFDGPSMSIVDQIVLQVAPFYVGTNATLECMVVDYTNIKLCPGNFIPDGDHADIEFLYTYPECGIVYKVYDGARIDCYLSAHYGFFLPSYDGPYMYCNLFVPEPVDIWHLNAYDGPFMRVSNPEFDPKAYDGAATYFEFAPDRYFAYDGAFCTVTKLTLDYNVEFLESGCLDNEFVPTTPEGYLDYSKFNPVPVELDYFEHSVLAHCF